VFLNAWFILWKNICREKGKYGKGRWNEEKVEGAKGKGRRC
jgi:hypothetical protein